MFGKKDTEFNASLLREKFVLRDTMPQNFSDSEPTIALSNRLVLPLQSGDIHETYIVRAQNMHACVRMGALIARDFFENGPLENRARAFDWHGAYEKIARGFEEKWNPALWFAVYRNGQIIHEHGKHHMLLDIIEQCDARSQKGYETSLEMAHDAFKHAGKLVNIDHNSNIALTVHITKAQARCGVILRGPSKTATFNFTAEPKDEKISISASLTAAAAFLEGIQLCFMIGMTRKKLYYELIDEHAKEAKKSHDAAVRLASLRSAITHFEEMYRVSYRAERPDFNQIIDDAQRYAQKALEVDIRSKVEHDDEGEWIV